MAIASRRGEKKRVGERGRLVPRGSGERPGARYGTGIKIKGVAFLSRNKMILVAFPRIVGLKFEGANANIRFLLRILFRDPR